MTKRDYRALCAELINHLQVRVSNEDREIPTVGYYSQSQQLLDRARALLDQPEKPTDEELLRMAASAIDPYESCGIAIGEYEPETQIAVEVYGSELIAYARAVLARWGTPANTTREENLEVPNE